MSRESIIVLVYHRHKTFRSDLVFLSQLQNKMDGSVAPMFATVCTALFQQNSNRFWGQMVDCVSQLKFVIMRESYGDKRTEQKCSTVVLDFQMSLLLEVTILQLGSNCFNSIPTKQIFGGQDMWSRWETAWTSRSAGNISLFLGNGKNTRTVSFQTDVFWVTTLCGPAGGYQFFGGTYCLHFKPWRWRHYASPKSW
jgi:hypothetical protein